VRFDDSLGYREPQPGSGLGTASVPIAIEDVRQILLGDAPSRVCYGHLDLVTPSAGGHGDAAA